MYASLEAALNRARERSAATNSDELLTELLELSAGTRKDTAAREYRPFYVAARYLEQAGSQQIAEADGVKFTGMKTPIVSLMALQRSLDAALIVPEGFEAIATSESLPAAPTARLPRFGTSSVSSQPRP
jgi:hypothetical protein